MKKYQNIPILMYHHIRDGKARNPYEVSWERFAAQMRALKRWGYHAVSFRELEAHFDRDRPLPRRPVLITFDDAFAELAERVFPLLSGLGLKAAVFVPAGRLGGTNRWDAGKGYPRLPVMTARQVRTMAGKGMEIGSHGMSHALLSRMSAKQLRGELSASREKLERISGRKVTAFAYPYNDWNERVVEAVRQAGYVCACTIDSPARSHRENLFLMRRVHVKPGDSLISFRRKISQWYLWWRGKKGH